MSAPFFLPFNFQPVSVSVKTGSYTIPAGKYARVTVEVDSGGIFTINTINACTSAGFIAIDQANASLAALSYSVPTDYRGSAAFSSTLTDTYSIAGNSTININTNSSSPVGIDLGPGSVYSMPGGVASNAKGIHGVAIPSNATNRQATYWLPTGTVINGSGNWRAVVEEYNQIT